jgi:hypothetical protein
VSKNPWAIGLVIFMSTKVPAPRPDFVSLNTEKWGHKSIRFEDVGKRAV